MRLPHCQLGFHCMTREVYGVVVSSIRWGVDRLPPLGILNMGLGRTCTGLDGAKTDGIVVNWTEP